MTKKKLLILALLTIVGFTAIAYIIHYLTKEVAFTQIFYSEIDFLPQVGIGSVFGIWAAIIGWKLMLTPILRNELLKYTGLFGKESLNFFTITFISLSAGIGEEIFFRGILQEYLGVVITAIVFVAIHGYLNPKNWRISIYGVYMTLIMIIVGLMAEKIGLITAISAHALIDFVLLYLTKSKHLESL